MPVSAVVRFLASGLLVRDPFELNLVNQEKDLVHALSQVPRHVSPGSSSTRLVPVRRAFGGQVMGSMATEDRRRAACCTSSPV